MLLLFLMFCILASSTSNEHSLTASPLKHEMSVENTVFGKDRAINFEDNFGRWHRIWAVKAASAAAVHHDVQQNENHRYYIQPPATLLTDTIQCQIANQVSPPKVTFHVQFWNKEIVDAAKRALFEQKNVEISHHDVHLLPISEMWLVLANPDQRMQGAVVDSHKMSMSNNDRADRQFSLITDSDESCRDFATELLQNPETLQETLKIEIRLSIVHNTSRTLTVSKRHVSNGILYKMLQKMNPTNGQRLLTATDLTTFAQQITAEVVSTEIVEPYYYVSADDEADLGRRIEMSISQSEENSRSASLDWDLVYWPPNQLRPDRALDYLTFMLQYDENADLFAMNPADPPDQIKDSEAYERTRRKINDVMVFNYTKDDAYDGSGEGDISATELVPLATDPPTTEVPLFRLTSQNINLILNQCDLPLEWSESKRQFAVTSFDLHVIDLTLLSAASNITTKKVKMIPVIVRDSLNVIVPARRSNISTIATSDDTTDGQLLVALHKCRKELNECFLAENRAQTELNNCNAELNPMSNNVCNVLDVIANAVIDYSPRPSVYGTIAKNTVATLRCSEGFRPSIAAKTTTTCEAQWSASLTTCEHHKCVDPATLIITQDGASVTYSCLVGACTGVEQAVGQSVRVDCSRNSLDTLFDLTFDGGTTYREDKKGTDGIETILLYCNQQAKWQTTVAYGSDDLPVTGNFSHTASIICKKYISTG